MERDPNCDCQYLDDNEFTDNPDCEHCCFRSQRQISRQMNAKIAKKNNALWDKLPWTKKNPEYTERN